MPLTNEKKREIIEKFRLHPKDTASPQVQVAMLTARLDDLNEHFKVNVKDFHSRRGLMKIVSKRRHLLDYLHRNDADSYRNLIKTLGIRK